ncbi:hypothetical protein [Alicyclobacillus sp. ALC3]|uniref:hypothetical protein n=1 Tax=Alicyclobacillus sp. ALC3 TaxID=2796143 RepID=UPI002378AF31|nr:hypothetical protein [Alicyclobacillus sp. ALC3]WDL98805.1 hypothetical protein JC200_09210 [Alicyclobacillus sp. ALC3]
MKKLLWVLPVLAIGVAIGGLTIPNVFASSTASASAASTQAGEWMGSSLSTPQGQAMIQACEGYMSQYDQSNK